MKIVSHKKLIEFYSLHHQAKLPLESWYHQAKNAKWKNFNDIKNDFNSVDAIGNQRYVFNLKGNSYRLVVVIQFNHGYIFIRFVGTHDEFNKTDCKNI